MLGMSSFHPVGSYDRKTLLMSSWVFFHVIWKALSFYFLYHNLLIFLNSNGLNFGNIIWKTDKTLLPICYFFLIGAIINLFWFYDQKDLFTRIISLKLMIISKNKGVKRVIPCLLYTSPSPRDS